MTDDVHKKICEQELAINGWTSLKRKSSDFNLPIEINKPHIMDKFDWVQCRNTFISQIDWEENQIKVNSFCAQNINCPKTKFCVDTNFLYFLGMGGIFSMLSAWKGGPWHGGGGCIWHLGVC